MKWKTILIVTYGRSGSTLLQGMLNASKDVELKGENLEFCWHLYRCWQALLETKTRFGGNKSELVTSPWYGAGQYNLDLFENDARKIIKNQLLQGVESTQNLIYGFKEIRYLHHLDDLEDYLQFLTKVFPDVAFVFNIRNHEDVVNSGWWKNEDSKKLNKKLNRADALFRWYALRHRNSFVVEYDKIVKYENYRYQLFSFLGLPYNARKLNDILARPHSYDQKSENLSGNSASREKKKLERHEATVFQELTLDSSSNPRCLEDDEVLLISAIKNEIYRLPWFFTYYRRLGIKSFVIVDNGSSDGSIEFLRDQPDVLIYHAPPDKFGERTFGIDWINVLSKKHGMGKWVLSPDADELLCWPGYQRQGIKGLLKEARRLGLSKVFTPMIDAYSDMPVIDMPYSPGENFGKSCPWVDSPNKLQFKWGKKDRLFIYGGPRLRHALSTVTPPLLSKQRLMFMEPGGGELAGSHFDTKYAPSMLVAPLLHYKFLPNIPDKGNEAIVSGQHFRESIEYKVYKETSLESLCLKEPDSILVENGLSLSGYVKKITNVIVAKFAV